jgi:hypothetical protein
VAPIALAAAAGVVVAAGANAVCSVYIHVDQLPPDLRYLADTSAPDTGQRLLPSSAVERLAETCSDRAREPIARFTRPGAFSNEYSTVADGVCTDTFGGAVLVAVVAWGSLVGLICIARAGARPEKPELLLGTEY